VNILERFGGTNIHWGLSECLLVDGHRVIVTPGGSKGLMAALDKRTGQTVWTSEPLRLGDSPSPAHERVAEPFGEVDGASYASPIIFEQERRRMIVSCSSRHAFGVDAETGRLLWTRPLPTRFQVIATTPVRINDAVFVTAPDGQGGSLYRLRSKGRVVDVESVWRTELDACQGGAVYWNGALYGAMYRRKETWVSLDARTGAVQYRLEGLDKGAVLYADQRLYCVSEDGEIALLNLEAEGFEQMGRFQFVAGRKNDVWAHPVIANGRLYLRYNETLHCYDVKAR
jgi:outer membrane protein assembly factor BamB